MDLVRDEIERESSEELFKTLLVSIYNESKPPQKENPNRNEEFYTQVCIPSPSLLTEENVRRSMSVVSTHATGSEIITALGHSTPIKQSRSYTPQSRVPLIGSLDLPLHLKPLRNIDTPDSMIGGISNFSDSHTPRSHSDIYITTPTRLAEFDDILTSVRSTDMAWNEDDMYRKELNDRSRERDRLQNELKSKDDKIRYLKRQMEDGEERSNSDSEQLRQLKEKVRRLERDCEVGKKEKDGVEEGQQWLQSQLDQMMKERMKLQQELATSRGLVLSKGSELENTKAELNKVSRDCSDLRAQSLKERAQIVTTLEGVEEEVLSKDSRLEELDDQVCQIGEERDRLLYEVNQLNHDVMEYETSQDDSENQLRFQQQQLTEASERLEESEKKRQELKREISQMNMQVETNQNQMSKIQKVHDGLQVQKTAAERLLVDKDNVLGGLSQEKQLLEQQLCECREQISHLNSQIAGIQGELAEKKRRVTELEMEEESRVRAIQRAIQERDFAQAELQDVKQEFNDLLKQKDNNEKKLQKELETKEKKVRNVQYAMRDVGEKMKNMENQLNDKLEREQSLVTELDKTKRENQLGKLQVNQLKAELNQNQLELANTQEQSRQAKEARGEGVQFLQEERAKLLLQVNQARMEYDRNLSVVKQELRQSERDKEVVIQQLTADQQKIREKQIRSEEALRRALEHNEQLEQEVKERSTRAGIEKARSLEKLEKRYEIMQQQNNEMRKQQDETKRESDAIHSQLDSEYGQRNLLLRELEQAKRDCNDKTREVEQLLSQKGNEVNAMKSQLNATQQGYAQLTEHAHLLERALTEKEGMLTRLSAQAELVLSQKQAEDNETQEMLNELTSRARQYEKERDVAFHEATLMKERVKRVEADLRASHNNQTSLQDRKDSQELRVANLEGKYRASEQNLNALESRYGQAETEKTRLQAQVKQFEGQLNMRAEQASFLQERLNMAQTQTAELEAHALKLEEMLSSSEKRHQSEIQSLRGMYSTLQETTQPTHEHVLPKGSSTTLRSTGPSKNVAALQNCLVSLKEDMGKLQSQMYQQVENVNTSFTMSKKFDNHVSHLNVPNSTETYPKTSTPKLLRNLHSSNYSTHTDY